MIIYIATHGNNRIITEAVDEANEQILKGYVEAEFDLKNFVTNEMEKLSIADTFIIDLSVLKDSEQQIIDTLNSYRLLNDSKKIIVLAPYKKEGDNILSEIVSLAIYNLVVYDEDSDMDEVKEDLVYCLREGKRYKDSIKYKNTNVQNAKKEIVKEKAKTIVKEKVIIKKEIRQTVSKAIIGIMGTQRRIGTTHNVIVSAMFLRKLGYSVAVVESNRNETKAFMDIARANHLENELVEEKTFFSYKGVDFYPDYELKENYKLQAKNYNFIIQDFGYLKDEKDIKELDRCVMQIIIGGYKNWETESFNKLFEIAGYERLKQYRYLFNFTAQRFLKQIRNEMAQLPHVHIAGYAPDPFEDTYSELGKMYKDYIPQMKNESDGVAKIGEKCRKIINLVSTKKKGWSVEETDE